MQAHDRTFTRRRTRRGFTLLELLTVMVIIGIVAAFVAPRIDLTGYRVDGATRSIGTSLLAAQRLAVTRQHDVVVTFDTAAGLVRILDDGNNNGIADPGEHVTGIPAGDAVLFGRGGAPARSASAAAITFTQIRNGLPAVTFHRDGSASEDGVIYLTSRRELVGQDHPEDTHAIEVARSTGRASWYHWVPPTWKRGF